MEDVVAEVVSEGWEMDDAREDWGIACWNRLDVRVFGGSTTTGDSGAFSTGRFSGSGSTRGAGSGISSLCDFRYEFNDENGNIRIDNLFSSKTETTELHTNFLSSCDEIWHHNSLIGGLEP